MDEVVSLSVAVWGSLFLVLATYLVLVLVRPRARAKLAANLKTKQAAVAAVQGGASAAVFALYFSRFHYGITVGGFLITLAAALCIFPTVLTVAYVLGKRRWPPVLDETSSPPVRQWSSKFGWLLSGLLILNCMIVVAIARRYLVR